MILMMKLATLVVFGVLLVPMPSIGAASSECVAIDAPEASFAYDSNEVSLQLTFDLARCRREDSFMPAYSIEQTGVPLQSITGISGCFGTRLRSCVIELSVNHQAADASRYTFEVTYPGRRKSRSYVLDIICASAAADPTATCKEVPA
jgi:hypothetical protein